MGEAGFENLLGVILRGTHFYYLFIFVYQVQNHAAHLG